MSTVGDVVVSTAICVMQLSDILDNRVFLGTSNGMNTEVTVNFLTTLKAGGSSSGQILMFFRELYGLMVPLSALLSQGVITDPASRSNTEFIMRFINTTGAMHQSCHAPCCASI